MHEAIASPLEAWGSFYVIVGSSAGALTGLQFVVMTLIAQTEFARGRKDSISAFGTPDVVHFCAVLLVASILTVPWSALRQAGLAVAGCGVLGSVYSVVVIRRAHRQSEYRPVFEDWLWHTILPVLAYLALFGAGAVLELSSGGALLVIAAAALLLVFIGIHNAWDTVTYVTMRRGSGEQVGEIRSGERTERRTGAGTDSLAGMEAPAADPRVGSGSASNVASTLGSTATRTPEPPALGDVT